ncbi:MAG: hypothetical protein AB7O62_16880 [Pirellulales bacterium]
MDHAAATNPVQADDATWLELEDLLDEVARLSTPDTPPREFHAGLLDRAVRAMAASAGAIFLRGESGLRLEYQINFNSTRLLEGHEAQRRHGTLLESVLHAREPRLVPPRAGGDEPDNPTELLLVLAPIVVEGEAFGVLEVCLRATTDAAAQRGMVRLMSALCELAADYQRQRQFRELRQQQHLTGQLEQFTDQIHARLDLKSTAFTIANEGRQLADCDRLSVLQVQGTHCRVLCVSGVDRVERRANDVRLMERLASTVVAAGEPLWHGDEDTGVAPQIDSALQGYLDHAHSRLLAVVPITERDARPGEWRRPRTIAALVFERFESGRLDDVWQNRAETVVRRSTSALRNARTYERLPFLSLLRVLQWIGSWLLPPRLLKTALALGLIAAAAAALILVPADFDIEGRGELQPKVRRDVFAPVDGVIRDLRVKQGDRVDPQDQERNVLAIVDRPELALESARLRGETQTAAKRLATVQAQRLNARALAADPAKLTQLTAEEEELKELLSGLEKQQRIIAAQQAELVVRAPLAGEVLTWNLHELLDARPVQRGQVLMTLADVDGPWVLEIRLADERIGHVLEAQAASQSNLEVTFVRATQPGIRLHGHLIGVAETTELDVENRPTVLLTVEIDAAQIADRRPGATVVAKVHCGRRPLGFVWFHEVWEALQRKLLF